MKNNALISTAFIILTAFHAQADVAAVRAFSAPGIIKVEYPANFVVASGAMNQAAVDYAKKFLDKATITPDLSFDQVAVLLTAYTQEGGEYAHLNVTMTPAEISQEDLTAADADMIEGLKDAMALQIREGFRKSGIELVGDFTGKREDLAGGIKCFTLGFSYKKSDGSIRIDTKRYIYTKRHTINIGITTSPGYAKENGEELERIVTGITATNN